MNLHTLLAALSLPTEGYPAVDLQGIALNHQNIQPGFLFVAVKGEKHDARDYIPEAIRSGAAAVFYEPYSETRHRGEADRVPCIPILNLKAKISQLAGIFYQNPSRDLKVIGITGTNGKTSISHFLAQAFLEFQLPCGVLGTIGNGLWPDIQEASRTTGDPIEIQRMLRALKNQGARTIAMEVSSHGLTQHRVEAIAFDSAIFTNLTRDHLDYHPTMENYYQAKKKLFDRPELQYAVIPIEDPYGLRLSQEMTSKARKILIGQCPHTQGDFVLEYCRPHLAGTEVSIKTPLGKIETLIPLIGDFQIKNLLSVIAILWKEGVCLEAMTHWLSRVQSVRGRMEVISRQPWVLIDYAHTPEGLASALRAIRPYVRGKLWVVFGCGGDRDRGKRSLMAQIAEREADHVIVSSDNPRSESLEHIFEDIRTGFYHPENIGFMASREEAVKAACSQLGPDDGLLLAGKGHERWEQRGAELLPVDEAGWAKAILAR